MNRAARRLAERVNQRGNMRYLRNEIYEAVSGKLTLKPADGEGIEREAFIGDFLSFVMEAYQPTSANQTLTTAETGYFSAALEILHSEPDDDGYLVFDGRDFDVMKKVVGWTLPQLASPTHQLFREAKPIDDLLSAVPTKDPGKRDNSTED